MTDFHDVRFPARLAFGATGGPRFQTDILNMASGAEVRQTKHAQPRRRYNAIAGIKNREQAIEVLQFYKLRRGRLYGFRFSDPLDYSTAHAGYAISATDESLGEGDGARTVFQLQKTYLDTANQLVRAITKPVEQTVSIAINGQQLSPTQFVVNALTGKVIFSEPPAASALVTAGFEFDVPVRFDTDDLNISLETHDALNIADIPLVEVLVHD